FSQPAPDCVELRRSEAAVTQRISKRLEPGNRGAALVARRLVLGLVIGGTRVGVVEQRFSPPYLAIRIRVGRPRDVLDESGCGAMTARSRQARMPLLALGSERDHSSRRYPYLLDLSRQASGLLKHAHDVVIRHQHHRRLRKIYVIGVAELPTQGGDQRR